MKKLILASLAGLAFAAPLAAAPAFADDDRRYRHERHERYDRGDDRRHHGYDRYDRYDRDYDNRDDRRDERRAYREGFRDGRHFDRGRHNGYYLGRSWHYGPPPSAYYGRHDYRPSYREWRRGDRLPAYYRDHYRPVDYRYHRLSPPPYGHHWVRDDRGDYLLVGVATGVILGLALAN